MGSSERELFADGVDPTSHLGGGEPTVALGRYDTEEIIGSEIDAEVWRFIPWSDSIVVKRLPSVTKVGMIYVPDNAKEKVAAGHVIRCGISVGYPTSRKSVPICPYGGEMLLGKLVLFGHYAGKAIQGGVDRGKDPYESEYLILTEADIWGVIDTSLPSGCDEPDAASGEVEG